MAKGDKLTALSRYIEESNKEEIILEFNEIEKIIGAKLCNSAYIHKAYWYLSDTHTFPIAWIQSGYKFKSLDLNKKVAIFIKE